MLCITAFAHNSEQFQFDVVVRDSGSVRQQDTATVTVSVLDKNDNAPRFSLPLYRASVPENTARGAVVSTAEEPIEAADPDAGKNGVVKYSLEDDGDSKHFSINEESGEVRVAGDLDREKKER